MSDLKAVDLNDLALEDEALLLDPDADAFQGPPPPPDGIHLVKLALFRRNGESPFQAGKDKHGRPYIMASVVGTLIAEGRSWNNQKVFDRVSTVILGTSGTCRMAGVLKALGIPVPATTTMKGLAQMFENALEGEPLIGIETQWQCRSQRGDTWETILRGMKKFPQRQDGGHQHIITDPETGELVTAQANVLRYVQRDQVKG